MKVSIMNVEFIRFKASDDVELQGWLNEVDGELAVVHIHGMSGNGYENYFVDSLRDMYLELGITFFTIDTRGRGIISGFRKGDSSILAGSCYEIFEDSAKDIAGAVDFLKGRGKKRFMIQGHSLGSSKVINFVLNSNENIAAAVLLAPTDMVLWAENNPRHDEYLRKAEELNSAGKGEELVGAQCWRDKTPLSAQTYPTICKRGTPVDIFSEREGGSLISKVEAPVLIAYGDNDIGITEVENNVDTWRERINKVINDRTKIEIIPGATHSFRNHESELADICKEFVEQLK